MELQVVLIGAVIFVISAIIIYLISVFTMKEKTFEEVIAEQKRKQEEEENKVKSEKKAEKDTRRRFKKGKDKVKDHSPKPKVAEDVEPKMVNIELEPEIFEPVAPETPLKINKKKEKASKSILLNKGEKTPIVPEEYVEEFVHRIPTPKDDLELKHIHEAKKDKPTKETKDKGKKHNADSREPEVVEEIIIKKEKPVQSASPPSESGNRTTFKKDTGIAKLIASVTSETLSDADIQTLIDVLHEKQGSTDWNKKSQKGDPVVLLRKQLEEKERLLQEEQEMLMSANTKLKEIRQELNQEKLKYSSMEKIFKEKCEHQVNDIQALHSRLQHVHDQYAAETAQLRTSLQKPEEQADQSRLQRLIEENNMLKESLNKAKTEFISLADANSLKQKVSIMEKELSSNALKLNASENTKKTLEQKLAKLEIDLKKYETQQSSTEKVMEKRVEEISQELRKAEAKSASLSEDLQKKEQAVGTAQKECSYLKSQLQDLEKTLKDSDKSTHNMEEKLKKADKEKADIQENLKNLQNKIENFEKEKANLMTDIQGLKQENSNLNTELQMTKEQLQTAPAIQSKQPNGDVSAADMTDIVSMNEHKKQLHIKEAEIGNLSKELEVKQSELTALTKQLEVKQSDIESLTQQVEAQKKKNNELREKNWKAMDALEKSEKFMSEKVKSEIKENREELLTSLKELETFDKSVMHRLFPGVSVEEKQSHKDWMSDFENEVSKQLTSLHQQSGNAGENSAKQENRIKELEAKTQELETQLKEVKDSQTSVQSLLEEAETSCSKLQIQVSHYRNVLSETEKTLTHLESSVEAEEKKWQERLQAKELELQQAKEEVAAVKQEMVKSLECQEMKKKVEELETKLQSSEGRCSELEALVKQAETRVTEHDLQIIELQKSSTDVSKLNTSLEELQKKNKDLASQIVKLNGIIKTGHDALAQEQNLVKKLQDQLGKTNLQNGTGATNDTSELDKASSQGSLTEAGTSV